MSDYYQGMLNAAVNFGLLVDYLTIDGEVHRVPTTDKPKSKNGWYQAFSDTQVIILGNWQTNTSVTWKPDNAPLIKTNQHEINKKIRAREAERAKLQLAAAYEATEMYKNAKPADRVHPYLLKKMITPCKVLKSFSNKLLVPLVDLDTSPSRLLNLQRIDENGEKRFLKNGRISGLCCPVLGSNLSGGETSPELLKTIFITEGYATAVSIHTATKHPVLAAMNANNLLAIASIAKRKWPDSELIIAGDDDWLTEQKIGVNIGKDKATDAAKQIGAKVSFPPFSPEQKERGLTDWNDYFNDKKEVKAG
jgi:putative DNA primase/helicase